MLLQRPAAAPAPRASPQRRAASPSRLSTPSAPATARRRLPRAAAQRLEGRRPPDGDTRPWRSAATRQADSRAALEVAVQVLAAEQQPASVAARCELAHLHEVVNP